MCTPGTWELVRDTDLPSGHRPASSKWVYKIKENKDGTIDKFKARFTVRGFTQRQGIDYERAFSATLRSSSFRTLCALAAQNGLQMWHVDAVSAFTQADMDVDLFVQPARGYEQIDPATGRPLLLKLKRALYGTKQASRLWQESLSKFLTDPERGGFTRSSHDPCVYTKGSGKDLIVVACYVDDICVVTGSLAIYQQFYKTLQSSFNVEEKGKLDWFLGMEVIQHDNGNIELSCCGLFPSALVKPIMSCSMVAGVGGEPAPVTERGARPPRRERKHGTWFLYTRDAKRPCPEPRLNTN